MRFSVTFPARLLSLFCFALLCLTLFTVATGRAAYAQIRLTEVVTVGTLSDGTYIDRYDWHTSSLPSQAYNLWMIEGTNINGAFINGPDRAHSAINLPLSVGDHTYTLYGSANLADVSYYGINLGFNGIGASTFTGRPQISAYGPAYNGNSTNFVANGSTTRYFDTPLVQAANTLSYNDGTYTVTLVEFFNARRDYPMFAGIDRVSDYTTSPGGGNPQNDNIGRITLRVTANAAPEPSTVLLFAFGLTSSCGGFAVRRAFSKKAACFSSRRTSAA